MVNGGVPDLPCYSLVSPTARDRSNEHELCGSGSQVMTVRFGHTAADGRSPRLCQAERRPA